MSETTNEELIYMLNPFNYTGVIVNRVIDENRKSVEWFKDYLALNEPVTENEFYVLFPDGLLVKKGRSKFLSSGYLKGEKFKSFKKVYNG